MKSKQSQEELLDVYVKSAIAHGDASARGDYKSANRSYRLLVRALHSLDNLGRRLSLVELLNHTDPSVRAWSATHLLPYREKMARAALQEVVNEKIPLISFDASMVIKEWDKGTLKIP